MIPPIEQDNNYHNFSDDLIFSGIPNFWNVISNLPFLIIGIFGLSQLKRIEKANLQFYLFFIGVSLIAFGSGYYHYNPNNNTLIWDRLPMTVTFTALISIVISEFIDYNKGKKLLLPFVLLGIFSIFYWVKFNDLRLYVLIQFYPIIAIPVILLSFKKKSKSTIGFWYLLIAYLIAKIFETYDSEIHSKLKILSGHTLKHIMAFVGLYLFIKPYTQKNKATGKTTVNN